MEASPGRPQITGRHIDLIADADGIKTPIARLRYFGSPRGEGSWVLHWRDAEGTFQIYRNLPAADAVSAVSYTHLDVYKRQTIWVV